MLFMTDAKVDFVVDAISLGDLACFAVTCPVLKFSDVNA